MEKVVNFSIMKVSRFMFDYIPEMYADEFADTKRNLRNGSRK